MKIGLYCIVLVGLVACGQETTTSTPTVKTSTPAVVHAAERTRDARGTVNLKALDESALKAISTTPVDGFELKKSPYPSTKSLARMAYVRIHPNEAGFQPKVDAIVQACLMCQAMDFKTWEANPNVRKNTENSKLKGSVGHVWSILPLEFGDGQTAIAVYEVGYHTAGPSTFRANGLKVFYNNGVNEILLTVGPVGFIRGDSVAELTKNLSQDDMVDSARTVLKALTSHIE